MRQCSHPPSSIQFTALTKEVRDTSSQPGFSISLHLPLPRRMLQPSGCRTGWVEVPSKLCYCGEEKANFLVPGRGDPRKSMTLWPNNESTQMGRENLGSDIYSRTEFILMWHGLTPRQSYFWGFIVSHVWIFFQIKFHFANKISFCLVSYCT